jgi:release factor glutamine methyltransferase
LITRQALLSARERLRLSGSDEPEIEAEVLLRHTLNVDRATFLRLLQEPISDAEAQTYERVLYRRFQGEPTAYITGTREFYGLDFEVTPAVLIPRPETEMLVEAVIADAGARDGEVRIADIGTGSGAVAACVAKALPAASITATDISAEALAVARRNARRHAVEDRIRFAEGDLLAPLTAPVEIIAANLPYVTEADWRELPREIREHEPRIALTGGEDGLELIRRLLHSAPGYLAARGNIYLEFGIGEDAAIQAIARELFPRARIETRDDFAGIPRLLAVLA